MGGLEVPTHLTGRHVEGNDGRTPLVIKRGALAGEEVRGRVTSRQVDQAQLGVIRHRRPHVRRTTGVGLAGRWPLGGVRVARVPGPHQLTAAHVERTHHARRLTGGEVIGHTTADDHHIARHQRRRGLLVVTGFDFAHVGGQVDRTLVAEVGAGLASFGIDGDQARIDGRQEQAFDAGARGHGLRGRRRGAAVEVTQATATLPVWRAALGVELPALGAGVSVQGEDFAVGGAHVNTVTDLQRRVLVFSARAIARGNVASTEGPGHLQLVDIAFVDLVQRGKAVARRGVAPVRPVFLLGTRNHRGHGRFSAGLDHMGRHKHIGQGHHHAQPKHARHTIGAAPGCRARSAHQGRIDQRHHQADHGEGQDSRNQRPVFQAGVPHRPDGGQHQRHAVQPGATRFAAGNQQPGNQHRQAHQQEVPTAPQAHQVTTATCQAQADQRDQGAQPRQQPFAAGGSSSVFHLGNFSHFFVTRECTN